MQLSARPSDHLRFSQCTLRITDWRWPLAARHGEEIARNWHRLRESNPGYFNGTVYLSHDYAIEDGHLVGTVFRTDFQTMLYWRSLPFAESDTVREVFGASLIRSAEGYLLFGRQAPGQLNSGLIYPPSGVIDLDDVVGDAIDIDRNIARELREETGLSPAELQRTPGYIAAIVGRPVAIGIEWRSSLHALELRERIIEFLQSQPAPELDEIVIVRNEAEAADERIPGTHAYSRALCLETSARLPIKYRCA